MGIHCRLSQPCKCIGFVRRAGLPSELANSVEAGGADGDQAMPFLQLDVPNHYPVEVKRGLARRLGEKYARIMQTTPDMVTVAFRELGEGGVWRCSAGEPEPAAVLSCDIRRGRPPEQPAELGQAPLHARVETLGLRSDRPLVGVTQHTQDRVYPARR